MVEGHCMKCKTKREMKDVTEVVMKGKGKTKRQAFKGVCVVCGCKMFRIKKKEEYK